MEEVTVASASEPMGRLERVDLREAWETEDGDFTPWLASEDNIALLGEAISIDLEVEAQEKQVGPFRADILCLDTASTDDHWILIENQLNRTDHTHLGQLMTYAAGLDAVTIVWIARQFIDEHRKALDWLNEITDDIIRFFGIEVELWRIGDSPMAPKFNIVSKPNDWTATSKRARQQLNVELTPYKQLQVDYWGELQKLMQQRQGNVRPRKPLTQHWQSFSIGKSNFILMANYSIKKNLISAGLELSGADAQAHLALLLKDKEAIENEMGKTLIWDQKPGVNYRYLGTTKENCDLKNKDTWPELLEWQFQELEAYYRVFAPRIKDLNAEDYIPAEPDLDDTEEEDEFA